MARLDERLYTSPIRDGWIARSHFTDACASIWIEGDLVSLEDLVLHDADADARAPTPHLSRAKKIVDSRREIEENGPGWVFSSNGLGSLLGRKIALEIHEPFSCNQDDLDPLDQALADIDAVLVRSSKVLAEATPVAAQKEMSLIQVEGKPSMKWQKLIDAVDHLPPVLAAGLLWEAWEMEPPVWRSEWMGRQLTSAYLVRRKKARWHLPALNAGLRQTPWERRRSPDKLTRILTWFKAVLIACEDGLREHDRLKVGLNLLQHQCAQRRSTSRLPELVTLIGEHPLVTVGIVAKKLNISQRSAQNLISSLDLREVTGRDRYRAWML